jgi:carboxypeptidase T
VRLSLLTHVYILCSSLSFVAVVYPWAYANSKSPDDEALQALGRKIQSFNDYELWAGSQPDFQYAASGVVSDYMYAALGVASFGFEIGDDFYQECAAFEDEIVPMNMPALLYAAKIAGAPYREVKGPDLLDFKIVESERKDKIVVSARASDGEMVNAIAIDGRFDEFPTGDQSVAELRFYFDDGAKSWATVNNPGDETVQVTIDSSGLTPGRHTLSVQATDSDGYKGPISSRFVSISQTQTISNPPTLSPTDQSTFLPTSDSSGDSNFFEDLMDFLSALLFD